MQNSNFDSIYHCNKGQDRALLEQYEAAIAEFDMAIASDPRMVDAWHYKGIALKCLQHYSEAIVCLKTALSLDPNNKQISHQVTKVARLRLDELAAVLRTEDVSALSRLTAVEELGAMRDPNVIDPLLRVLLDDGIKIRSGAMEGLSKFHNFYFGQNMSAMLFVSDRSALDPACRQFITARIDDHVKRCVEQFIHDPHAIYVRDHLARFSRITAQALGPPRNQVGQSILHN